MGKISFSYFELRFFKVTYSRLQKKLIPSLTRTKINFLWISFIHLLSFYLDNLNLPLTRSNFCFVSDHFYVILHSIIRNVLRSVLKFISTQPCILCLYFFVNPLQIQCPEPWSWIFFKLCCFNSFFKVSSYPSLSLKWSVHDTCIPSHPFVYFLIFGYQLWTPDNLNFFRFP